MPAIAHQNKIIGNTNNLNELSDVNITSPTDKQGLVYNASTGKWVNGEVTGGGLLPHFYIDSESGSTVTVITPDGDTITPTQISSGHWECDVPSYGVYTVHAILNGEDATVTVTVDDVKEYHITDNHYSYTLSVYAPTGSTIRVSASGETYTGTGAGSTAVVFALHQASTAYTITNTIDGVGIGYSVTTPSTTGGSGSRVFTWATINLTYDADFVGATITCTKGSTTITKTGTSELTATFYIPTAGEWVISSTISGQTYSTSVTVSAVGTAYSANLKTYTIYGFHVDSSISSSGNSVSYQIQYDGQNVKNYDYSPAYMDFANDKWEWGSWSEDDFFMPRPVLISQDYQTKIYLDPDNLTLDVDGNDVSAMLTGTIDGYNAMMEFGKNDRQIWYKLVPSSDPTSYTCYVADMKLDNDFVAWSFFDANDVLGKHFYMSIYAGSVVSNTLRSLSGKARNQSTAGATQITYAKANNKHGEEYAWYIDVFADRILIDLLMILVTKSINSDVIGYGNYTGGSSASSLLTTGLGNQKGMFYGKQSNGVVKVFGIENYFADAWRRMAGLILSSGVQLYKLTYGTADGSSAKGYQENDNAPSNYIAGNTIATDLSTSYIKKLTALTNGALLASEFGGANGTYYSDACWSATGARFALVGGGCTGSSACGAFALYLTYALSNAGWGVGCVLSLKPLA